MDIPQRHPQVLVSRIPSVATLFQRLGLPGFRYKKRNEAGLFKEFRMAYKTSDGRPGLQFKHWEDNYADLIQMAESFLSTHGWRFWRDKPGDASSLQLSKDRHILTELLAELFFRQNKHTSANEKHRKTNRVSSNRERFSGFDLSSEAVASRQPRRRLNRLVKTYDEVPLLNINTGNHDKNVGQAIPPIGLDDDSDNDEDDQEDSDDEDEDEGDDDDDNSDEDYKQRALSSNSKV
jgi:hypothetical protein